MKFGPKYKIARRLGASVFEKTQTAKFALRSEQKAQANKNKRRPKALSNFAKQLIEKQRVRFTYGLSEKQFSKYIKKVIEKGAANPSELLFTFLERRLDNVALRSGFAPTRMAARQLVSHGHMAINGVRVNVPSYQVSEGDIVSIREGSKQKPVFADLDDRMSDVTAPTWLSVNKAKKEVVVKGEPIFVLGEQNFDLEQVLQFYKL